MSPESASRNSLLAQQQAHLTALLRINEQLLRGAFETNEVVEATSTKSRGRKSPSSTTSPQTSGGNGHVVRKASGRASWFERGEAVKLSKTLLKKPMKPGELIRALADAKGYNGSLTPKERKQFQGAAYQALVQGVSQKALFRSKDGTLRASRTLQ